MIGIFICGIAVGLAVGGIFAAYRVERYWRRDIRQAVNRQGFVAIDDDLFAIVPAAGDYGYYRNDFIEDLRRRANVADREAQHHDDNWRARWIPTGDKREIQ